MPENKIKRYKINNFQYQNREAINKKATISGAGYGNF